MTTRLRVAVLFGGRSSEHEVSLAIGPDVIAALDPAKYEVVPIAISREGIWGHDGAEAERDGRQSIGPGILAVLTSVDVVLPALLGPFGEDGTVQGLLELVDTAYVGSGVAASALCMDKALIKDVLRAHDIETAPAVALGPDDPVRNPFGYPVFVKPARLGSSIAVSKVEQEDDLAAAVQAALVHDDKVLVEAYVPGIEVECGLLGNDAPAASVPGELVPHGSSGADWYDYSAKYGEDGVDMMIPARITDDQAARVQELARRAFVAAGCAGLARIDFFLRPDGHFVLNEVNTLPCLGPTNAFARFFAASGIEYPRLLDRLIELALERHEQRRALAY